ncbi:MAG: hypothetical protein LBT89_10675 [Planctomycetaceae bacterium]|jgi:RsiW-degrading membrane proteinase PrsW (M82 family)|nr:hypothetical protein [Planctomycetaceae bacterium]
MDNIYLELELFLDPPVTEPAALIVELNRKIGEWNKLVVSSPRYKVKVAAARQFIKDGLPNAELQGAAARTQKLNELRYAVSQQHLTGKIDERGFTKLKQLFPCFSETTIETESGFSPQENFQVPKMPPSLDCNRLIPAIEMEAMAQDLATVSNGIYGDLYELLGLSPETKRDELYKKALEANETNRRMSAKTPEVNAKNRLYGKAINFFKDDYNQLDYDAALQRQKFDKLCKTTLQHRAAKGIITTAIYERSIADICAEGLTQKESQWLVYEYYCVKLKCPPPITLDTNGEQVTQTGRSFWDLFRDLFRDSFARPPQREHPVIATTAPVDVSKALMVDEEPTLLLESFRYGDVKEALTPVNEYTLPIVLKDKEFWQTTALCVLPMAVIALDKKGEHFLTHLVVPFFWLAVLVGFLIAVGVMLRRTFLKRSEDIRLPLAAFFFTAVIGVPLLLNFFAVFLTPKTSESSWFVGRIGTEIIGEEICKIIPVFAYLIYRQGKTSMKMLFLIAAFSSMGLFADKIFFLFTWFSQWLPGEILHKGLGIFQIEIKNVVKTLDISQIFSQVLPLFSLLIANIIWTAVFAYYLSLTFVDRQRWWAFVLLGISVSAALHGVYTACILNDCNGFAAMVVGASFILFYGYLSKIRFEIQKIHPTSAGQTPPLT